MMELLNTELDCVLLLPLWMCSDEEAILGGPKHPSGHLAEKARA